MFSKGAPLPPRSLVALIIAITVVPLATLLWLGWRLLDQDRLLEGQQVQERLERAADLAAAALQRAISSSEQRLAAGGGHWPEGSVTLTLREGRVDAYPPDRVAWLPVVPALREAPAAAFARGEELEFRRHDRPGAIQIFRELAKSADPALRAGALLRLARNLKSDGRMEEALATYTQLSALEGVSAGSGPAGLVARYARCQLLEESRRAPDLRLEAERLAADLHNARWPLTAPMYWLYSQDAAKWTGEASHAPLPAEIFADAAAALWMKWNRMPSSGRETMRIGGQTLAVIWQTAAGSLRILVAAPPFVESQWLRAAAPVAAQQRILLGLRDSEGEAVFGNFASGAVRRAIRGAADTGLPWSIVAVAANPAVQDREFALRRRLLIAGFVLLVSMALVASYFIFRAVSRELAVARLQSDFVAAVSHEFRTPLTALRQFTDMLRDHGSLSDERRQVCYEAQSRATDRLTRLVESLLDFGRMEAGARLYRFERRDCTEVVERAVDDFRGQVQAAGCAIEFHGNGSAEVDIDSEALSRAIWNLLENAVKYSPDRPSVEVGVHRQRPDCRARPRHRDTASRAGRHLCPLPPRRAGAEAGDPRNRDRTGDGRPDCESAPGPRGSGKPARPGQHVYHRASGQGGPMPRILIVEDEPDIALGLQLDLRDEGYEVEVVGDGEAAGRRGREPGWDLILLDIMLPRKDGFEVCRELRRAKVRTPILMLTAKAQEAEKVMGLDHGADDYVTKPFSPRELRARIRALLRRSAPDAEPVRRIGDCEIDFARAELRRAGGRTDLTAIELKMLEVFLQNLGRVVTRAQIIDQVWGAEVFVTDRVVDTHVVKLRRKMQPDPAQPRHIVSVRGLGYRFEA